IDATQWGFEIVGDGIRKRFELAALRVKGRRARSDTFFQLGIETVEGFLGAATSTAFHQEYSYKSCLQNQHCEHSDYPPLQKLTKLKLFKADPAIRRKTALGNAPASQLPPVEHRNPLGSCNRNISRCNAI